MFNDKQIQALTHELDSSRVKSRQKGNITLSYLEGHDIITTANKIFGFGNWDYSIKSLKMVSHEQNHNQNHQICYKAVVTLVIHDLQHSKHISREDVGFGVGIAKALSDAHEGGAKEAVTDALKRAFRTLGNQFGNSLYDKTKTHTQTTQQQSHQQITQSPPQPQHHSNPPTNQTLLYDPNEYRTLYNLGLQVVEKNGYLIVVGKDIFAKKDSIKAYDFLWDATQKVWYKPLQQHQQQAA